MTCALPIIRRSLPPSRSGGAVIPVFIWSPEEEGRWQPGAASRWWLHKSLAKLDASLRQRGSPSDHPPRPSTRGDSRAAGTIGCDRSLLEPPVRTNGHRTRQERQSRPASRWTDGGEFQRQPAVRAMDGTNSKRSALSSVHAVLESLPGAAGACPAGGRRLLRSKIRDAGRPRSN